MIFLQLTRREAEHGPLPSRCVRCGRPAFVWRTRRLREQRVEVSAIFYAAFPALLTLCTFMFLTWQPGNDAILELAIGFAVIAAMLANVFAPWFAARGLDVRLPFCEKHHLHWFKRTVYDLVCALFFLSLLIGCFVEPRLQSLLLSLMWLHLFQWLIVKTISRHRAVSLNGMTDRHVTLRGVHPKFREALFDLRLAATEPIPETSASRPEASIGVSQP
jgi:hypothetical protein